MSATLLIFDLDGTLMTTRAGRLAFNRAFERHFGIVNAAAKVPMAGRTDPAIYRDVCQAHNLAPEGFSDWKAIFLDELATALQGDPGFTHPGVLELLQACSQEADFYMILGTGNVEAGARLKLAPHDLNRFFVTGGFGDDGEIRADVIRRGITRAERVYEERFGRIVVIGDTPHDVLCGQQNHCLTLGVGTGAYSPETLAECGADLVVPDFGDIGPIMEWLRRPTA